MKKKLFCPAIICLMAAFLAGCATLLPEPIGENSSLLVIKRTLKNQTGTTPAIAIELFFDGDSEGLYVSTSPGYNFITELPPGDHVLSHYKWVSQDSFFGGSNPVQIGRKFQLSAGAMTIFPYRFDYLLESSKTRGSAISYNLRINPLSNQEILEIENDLAAYENAGLWRKKTPSIILPPISKSETIDWKSDGKGNIQYRTNDPVKMNSTWWRYFDSTNQTPMTTVTAQMTKLSGNEKGGVGIIFCLKDNNNFYRAMITDAGQYSVYKRVSGSYTPMQDWTFSKKINNGHGQANTISVSRTDPDGFSVFINDLTTPVFTFNDSSFSGGKAGFVASMTSYEDFPAEPVDIRFKMTAPAPVP